MSLDTKEERGSAISVGLPWRNWLHDPDGISDFGNRLSLLRYASAAGGVEHGGFRVCGTLTIQPLVSATASVSPMIVGTLEITPLVVGEVSADCDCGECE